jgi:formylglycine-generating enzyme required for sulfatase activity
LCASLHGRGVKVFVDWNPWDNDTRAEGRTHVAALAELVAAIDADGIFLDTLPKGDVTFRPALDAHRPGVVLESELALPVADIAAHHMSWAQWFTDSHAPGVLRNKWFERRHMQHQINRWDSDHTSELQTAWMNGSGMMIWENVFGSWNGWSARDRSLLRSMLPIQRRFASMFAGEKWTPLVPVTGSEVFASLWEGQGSRVWTLVNRSERPQQAELASPEHRAGESWFDLVAGREIGQPRASIGARGIGCLAAGTREALGRDFERFLVSQSRLYQRREASTTSAPLQTRLRDAPTRRSDGVPSGMIEIPGASFVLKTAFRLRECGGYDSQVVSNIRNELHRRATFERPVALPRYAIDRTPVTNEAFRDFLEATGWRPHHEMNFLKHWPDWKALRIPDGKDDHPVVYVDLEDARAYAAWARKSLPTEEAWQYAAQGPQEYTWPWGNEWRDGLANGGHEERDRATGAVVGRGGDTASVHAFSRGASPFGVLDLCGNVWEWTESERSDGRTRFALLKGGSYYSRTRSDWYADGGPKPNDFIAKFLLSWAGLDRCATIGFRCMVNLNT